MFFIKLRTFCHPLVNAKFSTFMVMQNVKHLQKCNKIMGKLMGLEKRRKKSLSHSALPSGGTPEFLNYISSNKSSGKSNHRRTVLNKVFMKNISDLMSTGEICPEVCNRGVQLSKINITPTFNQINVHWLANGTADDDYTEELLHKLAPKLRHELSQLKVMGVVPKIEFVKDSTAFKYMKVESILDKADFGDDFERTSLGHDWKSEYLSQTLRDENDSKPDAESSSPPTDPKGSLPAMRMDVFGLKHDFILSKISISMEKAKALHRKDQSKHLVSHSHEDLNDQNIKIIDETERRKLLQEYFHKKMMERKMISRNKRNNTPENILRQQEMENRYEKEFLKNFECEVDFDDEFDRSDDYLEEYNHISQDK